MGERNFAGVRAAALASAEILLPQWIPGKREGREWVGISRANGGPGNSWKVNLDTGRFSHFAGDERGGDLIDLYAQLNHLDLGAACDQLAQQLGINGSGIPVLPSRMAAPAPQEPAEPAPDPIPANAPPIPSWGRLGVPDAVYRYGKAFAVARYERPDGKTFKQWTWREGGWAPRGFGSNKPLYREDELAKSPRGQVLIVEGEKCADLAAPMVPIQVVVSWAGGAKAVKQTDWSAIADREVIIWPDADAPGISAAEQIAEILKSFHARVRILRPPAGTAEGWDIADGIASGMQTDELYEFIRANTPGAAAKPTAPIGELITSNERIDDENYPEGQPPRSSLTIWQSLPLAKDKQNVPHANLSNGSVMLRMLDDFRGKIWLDTFRDQIYHTLRGSPQQWTDADTRRITSFFQQAVNLPNFAISTVEDAVQHAAECNPRNSVQEWLERIEWDGVERLSTWSSDLLGVDYNDYTKAIARNWLIGMVARAYQPGCKMDHMPVLEGRQGLSKSSFLEVLGGEWYKSLPMQFGDKDFLQAIQGAWLVEIPDMTGFSQREHSHILATITIRQDEYRKSYGRRVESHPRVATFCATSERNNYLKSMNGRRRYWPLKCTDIHLDGLRAERDHLFAEAVIAYRAGEPWWIMPEEADAEQRSRSEPDPWAARVIEIAETYYEQAGYDVKLAQITCSMLLEKIGVSLDRQTHKERIRVGDIMEENGWSTKPTANARLFYKRNRPVKPGN